MKCIKCGNADRIKSGKVNSKQRYKCKNCGYCYTVERRSSEKPLEMKRHALHLYLEGMGFRAIGRILGVNYVTVYWWVKKIGETAEVSKTEKPVAVVELDEIHSYIARKKLLLESWLAVDRYGHRTIGFVCGKRNTKTFSRLWEKLRKIDIGVFCSDAWRSYSEVIHRRRYNATKKSTFTVEGYNSRIRHYLARFKRKTKCYSKSQHMMEISLKLLFLKWDNRLSIFT